METARAQAAAEEHYRTTAAGRTSLPSRTAAGAGTGSTATTAGTIVGNGKLQDKRVVITGGDAGVGRAVAVLFAREGAKVVIVHLPNEQADAERTKAEVEREGFQTLLVASGLWRAENCRDVVERIADALGGIDILVNNVCVKKEQPDILDLSDKQWDSTMQVNVDSYFYFTKYAIPHMAPGSVIINSASVDAYIGSPTRLDYATSKGAITAFTRALSNQLVRTKGIRVNAVAAGPVDDEEPDTKTMGGGAMLKGGGHATSHEHHMGLGNWTPMQRVGQAMEVATSYLFLASKEGAFFSGQTLHPNGGIVVHG